MLIFLDLQYSPDEKSLKLTNKFTLITEITKIKNKKKFYKKFFSKKLMNKRRKKGELAQHQNIFEIYRK